MSLLEDRPQLFVVARDELAAQRHVFNVVNGGNEYSQSQIHDNERNALLAAMKDNASNLSATKSLHTYEQNRVSVFLVRFDAQRKYS